MSPRQRQQRIYLKGGYWYGDFRDYRDVGGRQEALKTQDRDEAEIEAARRLQAYREKRTRTKLHGHDYRAELKRFAAHHLLMKAKSGKYTDKHLSESEHRLTAAVERFGAQTNLVEIQAKHIGEWSAELSQRLAPQTVKHYLNAFSNMYRRAQAEGLVTAVNPVAGMVDKPETVQGEARFLEVPQAAQLLETVRGTWVHPIVATLLLTGARKNEGLGLLVSDINFERRTVRIYPNDHRLLKSQAAHRTVPLWPQLHEILKDYLSAREDVQIGGLLFPSPRTGRMVNQIRTAMERIAGDGAVHLFRHTYCAARLQTLDQGAPIGLFTVAREMGHGGMSLVNRVYGHLGEVRHRSEVVEYRVTQIVTNEVDAGGQVESA